jgi:hypothetical protein
MALRNIGIITTPHHNPRDLDPNLQRSENMKSRKNSTESWVSTVSCVRLKTTWRVYFTYAKGFGVIIQVAESEKHQTSSPNSRVVSLRHEWMV